MTTYLIRDLPTDLHTDFKIAAARQRRSMRDILLIAIDREIDRVLKSERKSKHCPIVQR